MTSFRGASLAKPLHVAFRCAGLHSYGEATG